MRRRGKTSGISLTTSVMSRHQRLKRRAVSGQPQHATTTKDPPGQPLAAVLADLPVGSVELPSRSEEQIAPAARDRQAPRDVHRRELVRPPGRHTRVERADVDLHPEQRLADARTRHGQEVAELVRRPPRLEVDRPRAFGWRDVTGT